jgi:DtxR family Mn-dependent transcriptional regulator
MTKQTTPTTPAVEDYLKTIFAHTEWQPEPITPSVLAARLGVAPSSVTEMVKRLAAAGLITHVPYGPLRLTPAGFLGASAVVRRHRLVETWLVREMGYDWDEVHDEADVLEHALSDRLIEAIDVRLGRPDADPHGDLIPAADGGLVRVPAVLLADAGPGHTGTVLRISDRDPTVLRTLAADSIGPGCVLSVLESNAVRLPSGLIRSLAADVAASIWLTA